jgi:twinkle protein
MIKVDGYISGVKYSSDILEKNGKQKCPVCPSVGKQNIKDTPLSVNLQKKLFKCHKCTWVGGWGESDSYVPREKTYVTPVITNQTDLKLDHLQHFSKRLITQEVLKRNKVKSAKNEWFAFTYYDGNTPIKIKYKTKPDQEGKKKLMQSADSMPWVYKYNDLIGQKEVMICEGEEEALIWEVAGFKHASSVDMGAPNKNDSNADGKLQCITNCFDVYEEAEIIYIAVDNDDNGDFLEKELIRRFGAEKCKVIDFSPYKDANEYALKESTQKLLELKENAKYVKIEGVFMASDFESQILDNYRNGQPLGTSTYFSEFDENWKWRLGEVTLWTGYNNEGKSLFLKQLMIAKSIEEGWKHALFSPEEFPADEWYTDILESYIGKSADKSQAEYNNYMTESDMQHGINFVNDYFINIYPEEDHSIDELLKKFSYAVRRYNIKSVTFDPYNQIHHVMNNGEREDLYISRFCSKLKRFALKHNVALGLVAHQNTPIVIKGENYPEPNIYKIKGGGTFSDKVDNVVSVWRVNRNTDKKCTLVEVTSQKIKKQKLTGLPGTKSWRFNRRKNRYEDMLGNDVLANLIYNKEHGLSTQQMIRYDEPQKTFEQVESDFLGEETDDIPF